MALPCRVLATEQAGAQTANGARLVVTPAFHHDGSPSSLWVEAIRAFHDDAALAQLANTRNPMSPKEREWADLITSRATIWQTRIEYLRIPFPRVRPPDEVAIVLGNNGGQDAFVFGNRTIGFDLDRLGRLYGSALDSENTDRINRFFDHEFTHILHKAWRVQTELALNSPLERALWACLTEGLGNYRSLSARWRDSDGGLSGHAETVLARLGPIFVERLGALEHATDADAAALMQGLSMGPFEQKWGALPVALWLSQEAKGGDHLLVEWVERGPWGVLLLARAHLPTELAQRLPDAPR